MSPKTETTPAELYTKMAIALGSFGALVAFAWVQVMLPPDVPPWMFIVFLMILGSMLGVDLVRDLRIN